PVVLPVVGDEFTAPITGIMSYSYGNFKIRPLGQLPPVTSRRLPRESVEPSDDPAVLSLAAFNVYNLSARNEEAKFDDLARTIVIGLEAPDIVVLSEVQDGDGARQTGPPFSELTIARLLQSISDAGGSADYRYADISPEANRDGGEPGGNIRVGFLYRSDRVELVERPGGDATTAATIRAEDGSAALYPSPARIAPADRAFAGARKPLVAEFRFRSETLFVIGNHFSSKGGDGYLFGHVQPPNFNSEVQRTAQAEAVRQFVEEIHAVDPAALVVVAGDLNDFVFSPPIRALQGADRVLLNLAEELLPESEIYSYIYEGNSQVLDHILVSRALFERSEPTVQFVHRYAEYLYENRHSDHDPILARFRLE
ncbi:MAG: endonuclease/exonuclease/phosphatase family protein, partial [Spirochaetia bacterium]